MWLENLNLRGGYKSVIIEYIQEKHPELVTLYEDIYNRKSRAYWSKLDEEMKEFTKEHMWVYLRDDDSMKQPFDAPPVVVNYFFHEEVKKSAKKAVK